VNRPELEIARALGLPSIRPLSVRLTEWYAGRSLDPREPEDQQAVTEVTPVGESDTSESDRPRENVIDLDAARRRRRQHQPAKAQVFSNDPWADPWF
jgi:hypothetical protein